VEPASLSEHCRDIDDRRAWNRHQPGYEPLLAFDRAGDMGAHRRIELRLDRHGEVVETGEHLAHYAGGVPVFGRLADEGSDAGNRVHRRSSLEFGAPRKIFAAYALPGAERLWITRASVT
jgi:hypothetical protein